MFVYLLIWEKIQQRQTGNLIENETLWCTNGFYDLWYNVKNYKKLILWFSIERFACWYVTCYKECRENERKHEDKRVDSAIQLEGCFWIADRNRNWKIIQKLQRKLSKTR